MSESFNHRHRALIDSIMQSMDGANENGTCENHLIECSMYVMPLATGLFFLFESMCQSNTL